MPISRRTADIFSEWHDGEPERGVVRLAASWAPRYVEIGHAARIVYWSTKWSDRVRSPQHDVPATYEHEFEGSSGVWVSETSVEGYGRGSDLYLPSDVACLGYALELETDNGTRWKWRKGTAHLVAPTRNKVGIVTSARYAPIVITHVRVTPAGLDDYR